MYVALFLVALLFLYVISDTEKSLYHYSVVAAILVLFPLTAWSLQIYFQHFYTRSQLTWLLPLGGIISYTAVMLYDRFRQAPVRRALMPMLCILLLLCGGVTGYTRYQKEFREEKTEYTEVFDKLKKGAGEDEIILCAPKELLSIARQYDGNIMTVYGRDMWEPELDVYFYDQYSPQTYSLYEHMQEPMESNQFFLLEELKSVGATYVIFNKENLTFDENLDYPMAIHSQGSAILTKIEETYHYVIYRVD